MKNALIGKFNTSSLRSKVKKSPSLYYYLSLELHKYHKSVVVLVGLRILCLGHKQHWLRHDMLRRGKLVGGSDDRKRGQAYGTSSGDAFRIYTAHGNIRDAHDLATPRSAGLDVFPDLRTLGCLRRRLARTG